MNNEHTKLQIRTWLEDTMKKMKSPNLREKLKRVRKEKLEKVAKSYGF